MLSSFNSVKTTPTTRVPPRPRVLLFFFFLLLVLSSTAFTAADDAPPKPAWSTDCSSPYQRCTTVRVHPDWAHPVPRAGSDKDNNQRTFYTVRLEGIYRNPESTLTVWYVGDSISADTLLAFSNRAGVDVVVVHPRGGRDARPKLACGSGTTLDPTRCWPSPACAASLKEQLDKRTNHFTTYTLTDDDVVDLGLFSLDQHAADLEFVIDQLTPAGRQNIILAEGLRGAVVMRYLARSPDRTNPAAMFVNPPPSPEHYHFMAGNGMSTTSPSSPSLSFYGPALDLALQRLLALCDQDGRCSYQLGATEGGWSRYLNIKRSIENGQLPCVAELDWGSPAPSADVKTQSKHHSNVFKNSFSTRWRSSNGPVVAETLRYMLFYIFYQRGIAAPTDPQLLSLVPAILYRLQRCNADDVAALNTLYNYLYPFMNSEGVRAGTVDNSKGGCSEEDVLYKYVWLMNDFQANISNHGALVQEDDTNVNVPINFDSTKFDTLSASKYRSLFEEQEEQHVYPPQEALAALQSVAANFPGYTNAHSIRNDIRRIANTKTKLLLFLSDLDIFFPQTAVAQLLKFYSVNGGPLEIRNIRGSAHLPLSGGAVTSCIVNNLHTFKDAHQFAGPDACLAYGERSGSVTAGAACSMGGNTTDAVESGIPPLSEDPHRQHLMRFIQVPATAYFGVGDAWQFTSPNPREPPNGRSVAGGSFFAKVRRGFLTLCVWLFFALCALAVGYGAYFLFLRIQYTCSGGGGGYLQEGDAIVNNGYAENWTSETSHYNLEGPQPPLPQAGGAATDAGGMLHRLGGRVRSLFGRGTRSYSQSGRTDADFFTLVQQQDV